MNISQQQKSRLGMGIYIFGMVAGLLLALFLAWADLEASLFNTGLEADQKLSLICPLAITTNQQGRITATIYNDSARNVKTLLQVSQTEGSVIMIKRDNRQIEIGPGQVYPLEWLVGASDAAWGRLILFRVFVIASSPLPALGNYCGILLINCPFLTGNQLLGAGLAVVLVALFLGGRLWLQNTPHRPLDFEKNRRLIVVIAVLLILNIFLAIFGDWLMAGGMFILNFLLGLVILVYQVNRL